MSLDLYTLKYYTLSNINPEIIACFNVTGFLFRKVPWGEPYYNPPATTYICPMKD